MASQPTECCVVDDGARCTEPVSSVTFTKKMKRALADQGINIDIDEKVTRENEEMRVGE